jgi:hypothetical protein
MFGRRETGGYDSAGDAGGGLTDYNPRDAAKGTLAQDVVIAPNDVFFILP